MSQPATVEVVQDADDVCGSPEVRAAMESAKTTARLVARVRELEGCLASLAGELAVARAASGELQTSLEEVTSERDALLPIVRDTVDAWTAVERIADREAAGVRTRYGEWAKRYGRDRPAPPPREERPQEPPRGHQGDDPPPAFIREGRAAGERRSNVARLPGGPYRGPRS